MITHHLTPDLLTAYAADALPEAFNLIVAVHLSMCDTCRAEAETLDALGGAVLEAQDDAPMSPDALARTLERVRGAAPLRARPRTADASLPAPLHDYAGTSLKDVRWQNIGMGLRQSILPTARGARARLLHIPAGAAVPDHSHHGTELTLVLQGAFRDATGRFAAGDIEIADQHLHHTPVAEEGADCFCLAVTDARLKFSGMLPRLAQPFLRI